jgi:hypothetical protein
MLSMPDVSKKVYSKPILLKLETLSPVPKPVSKGLGDTAK